MIENNQMKNEKSFRIKILITVIMDSYDTWLQIVLVTKTLSKRLRAILSQVKVSHQTQVRI